MLRTAANARRALTILGDLQLSAYRRWDDFHRRLTDWAGHWPASTLHGGTRRAGGVSDPTGEAAVNPRSDPAGLDLHQAYADLHEATCLLVQVADAVLPAGAPARLGLARLATPDHAAQALLAIETLLDALSPEADRSPAWDHWHRITSSPLDRAVTYADLEHAYQLMADLYETMCRNLGGGDPIRTECFNVLCPSRDRPTAGGVDRGPQPPAAGRLRCSACDRWYQRARRLGLPESEWERTRAGEQAATASLCPVDRFPASETGVTEGEAPQAGTGAHGAPARQGAA